MKTGTKCMLFLFFCIFPKNSFPDQKESTITTVYVTPAWQLCTITDVAEQYKYFGLYGKYLQAQIINSLQSNGIHANPSFYSSCSQAFIRLTSIKDFDKYQKLEPLSLHNATYIVPLITNPQVTKATLFSTTEWHFSAKVTLYFLKDPKSKLIQMFSFQLYAPFSTKQKGNEDYGFLTILGQLEQQVNKGMIVNKSTIYLQQNSITPDSLFVYKRKYPEEQNSVYFGQSDITRYNDEVGLKVKKCNYYVTSNSVDKVENLEFRYNSDYEVPDLFYGFITLPSKKVVTIKSDDFHVEQPPEALPNKVYTKDKILVGSLRELVPGSIVSYSMMFRSVKEYLTDKEQLAAKDYFNYPLGSDSYIYHSDTSDQWQVIVLGTTSKKVHFAMRGLSNFKESFDTTDQLKTFRIIGKGLPFPDGIFERYQKYTYPLVRTSTATSLQEFYSGTRDSIYKRIQVPCKALFPHTSPDSIAATVRKIHQFINDSLRYTSVSFGLHSSIPIYPDSLSKFRFGDCKDFTTFMVTNLRAAGIRALPALVNSYDDSTLFTDVPSFDALNHMVTYIPEFNWWIDPTGPAMNPWIIPEFLSKSKAVILDKDSIYIKDIPSNSDSVYVDTIVYDIKVDNSNSIYTIKHIFSQFSSPLYRAALKQIPSSKWESELYSSTKSGVRFTKVNTTFNVEHQNQSDKCLTILRTFTSENSITEIGNQKLLNFSETPIAEFLDGFNVAERKSDLFFSSSGKYVILVNIDSNKKINWPKLIPIESTQFEMSFKEIKPNCLQISIRYSKGTLSPIEYVKVRKSLLSYRDFFSSAAMISSQKSFTSKTK